MTLTQLKKLGEQYDKKHGETSLDSSELTERLNNLVEKHGVTNVAAVLGKTESSVLVYARHKNAKYGCIKQYDLIKAETILNNNM